MVKLLIDGKEATELNSNSKKILFIGFNYDDLAQLMDKQAIKLIGKKIKIGEEFPIPIDIVITGGKTDQDIESELKSIIGKF